MGGNLELIVHGKELRACTDTGNVYSALVRFAHYRGKYYGRWFEQAVRGLDLLPCERLTHPSQRLVIDVRHKTIEYIGGAAQWYPKGFVEARRSLSDRGYRFTIHVSDGFCVLGTEKSQKI